MRLLRMLPLIVLLAGCGGSDDPPEATQSGKSSIYRTVIEADGVPFEISWDLLDRTRATARVFGVSQEVAIDPSNVVVQATGCRVISTPTRIRSNDGVATYMAETNCSPAEVQSEEEILASRELAREIDLALNRVAASAPATTTVAATPAVSAKSLFEGSPFSAFDADDIVRFCAENWETRTADDGRTEYNPCKRRDAFR